MKLDRDRGEWDAEGSQAAQVLVFFWDPRCGVISAEGPSSSRAKREATRPQGRKKRQTGDQVGSCSESIGRGE